MPKCNKKLIILASESPRRLKLLNKISVLPDEIVPANIDETPLKNEKPQKLADRLSEAKVRALREQFPNHYILAADTVVACGQIILDKAENENVARQYLHKLSGRRHQVYGGIALITPDGRLLKRVCKTIVQFKLLTEAQIDSYLELHEWKGKAGGYAIQGFAGSFVKYIAGSYSNVVGLSLYDTMQLLKSGGYITDNKKG
jgi:septum formation protein